MKSINQIVENGFCTGCGLCESIAGRERVQMRISQEGFLRPVLLRSITPEMLATVHQVCPGVLVDAGRSTSAAHQESMTALWGPIRACMTGFAVDPTVRFQGSSGGGVSAIALHLLESRSVSFVAQIRADEADPFGNVIVASRTREEILAAAGSRYGPSAPLTQIRQMLDSGERFAFIGKPCDVAALRNYARIDARVDQQVVAMLSFMCAGVPSRKGTEAVVRKLGFEPTEIKQFRYRGEGWPGYAKAVTTDGRSAQMDYNRSWGETLNRHLQFRCKICPDGTGEFADVTCADAWYGKDGYPDFAEREGRSLVLARSRRGEALVAAAVATGHLATESLALGEIEKMQPYQKTRKQMLSARWLATLLARRWAPRFLNLGLARASMGARPVEWLRNGWGTLRRADGESRVSAE